MLACNQQMHETAHVHAYIRAMEESNQYHRNMQDAVGVNSRFMEHTGKQQIRCNRGIEALKDRHNYPATVQAVVQQKPNKIMLMCSWV